MAGFITRAIGALTWFDVNGYVGALQLLFDAFFELIGNGVGLIDGEMLADGQVEIHDLLRSGSACPQVVDIEQIPAVDVNHTQDLFTDGIGQFRVKDVPQGMPNQLQGFEEDVAGDQQ